MLYRDVWIATPYAGYAAWHRHTWMHGSPRCVREAAMIDLAAAQPANASSGVAARAVDGDSGSRWESVHGSCDGDGCFMQWLSVDLGSVRSVCEV